MLVLSRKQNEVIQINDDIEIKVIAIDGDQIKLGITAPKSVDIHRQEVYTEIQTENNLAAHIPENLVKLLHQDK